MSREVDNACYRDPGWQLMTPTLGGPIDPVFFARYNNTVQAALSSGPNVWVIIDVVSNRVNFQMLH